MITDSTTTHTVGRTPITGAELVLEWHHAAAVHLCGYHRTSDCGGNVVGILWDRQPPSRRRGSCDDGAGGSGNTKVWRTLGKFKHKRRIKEQQNKAHTTHSASINTAVGFVRGGSGNRTGVCRVKGVDAHARTGWTAGRQRRRRDSNSSSRLHNSGPEGAAKKDARAQINN